MSLGDLADAAGVSKGHLSSIEHGLAVITVQTISRLARGLGLPAFYLLASPMDDDRDQVAGLVRRFIAVTVNMRGTLSCGQMYIHDESLSQKS